MIGRGHRILVEVAAKHALSTTDLLNDKRALRFAHPRQEAMWRLRTELEWSFPRIGRLLRRDHSTIISGVRKYEDRIASLSTEDAKRVDSALSVLRRRREALQNSGMKELAAKYGRPWSPQDDDVLRDFIDVNAPRAVIAAALNRTRNSVISRTIRLGLVERAA